MRRTGEMIEIENVYFSASTNRSLNAMDLFEDILAFGSSSVILLYDYKKYCVLDKLDQHTDKVNCVRFFDSGERILSCSGDKTAIIWKQVNRFNFEVEYVLKGHSSSIDVGCSQILDQDILTLTSSNDGYLNVWKNDKLISSTQEKHFIFDIKLITSTVGLFKNKLIAVFASSDTYVYLHKIDSQLNLTKIAKLTGHHEWVRSVDFIFENTDTLMIASGGQDNFIRVWRIHEKTNNENLDTDLFFELDATSYSIVLDTVIAGHEDKVYCVRWLNKLDERLKLMSVSLDKSVIIWEQPEAHTDNLWFEKHRLGEISGNNLGLLSCVMSNSNDHLIVNSLNGALHYWRLDRKSNTWIRTPIILGHFQPVTDLHWDSQDNYLMSASLDATCRLHSVWRTASDKSKSNDWWFEIARPQVHGYELNCIAPITSTKFVSGADEKVLRVYEATNSFVNSFEKITTIRLETADTKLADFAAVPTLGLSNYAMNESDENKTVFKPETFDQPPKEESLLSNTLWPEIEKIYGHGYEIYSLAVNEKRQHIASSCKATNHEDSAVCLWNIAKNYSLMQRLIFHKLTITSIKYSPDGHFLATVSRDRNWALYKCDDDEYELIAHSKKEQLMHSRIIWSVCWTSDSQYFMTSSRDKQVIVWKVNRTASNEVTPCPDILKLKESAFSIDISNIPNCVDKYLVAFGVENGDLLLCNWSAEHGWTQLKELNRFHSISIRKVKFNSKGDLLATCGDDCFVRIIKIIL